LQFTPVLWTAADLRGKWESGGTQNLKELRRQLLLGTNLKLKMDLNNNDNE